MHSVIIYHYISINAAYIYLPSLAGIPTWIAHSEWLCGNSNKWALINVTGDCRNCMNRTTSAPKSVPRLVLDRVRLCLVFNYIHLIYGMDVTTLDTLLQDLLRHSYICHGFTIWNRGDERVLAHIFWKYSAVQCEYLDVSPSGYTSWPWLRPP